MAHLIVAVVCQWRDHRVNPGQRGAHCRAGSVTVQNVENVDAAAVARAVIHGWIVDDAELKLEGIGRTHFINGG